MKWIIKLILIFLLAISLVFLLKFNQTTIIIFTASKRIDISLSAIIIILAFIFISGFYGINFINIIRKKLLARKNSSNINAKNNKI